MAHSGWGRRFRTGQLLAPSGAFAGPKAMCVLLAVSGLEHERLLCVAISSGRSKVGSVHSLRAGLVLDAGPLQLIQINQNGCIMLEQLDLRVSGSRADSEGIVLSRAGLRARPGEDRALALASCCCRRGELQPCGHRRVVALLGSGRWG